MEQGMYQEIENQRNDRIRILRKLLLGGLLFLLGWSAITGMEYHSYKEKTRHGSNDEKRNRRTNAFCNFKR